MVTAVSSAEELTKLTENRIEVMTELRKSPSRPKELAEAMEKSQSAISRTLSRMKDEGWIEQAEVEIGGRTITDVFVYQLTQVGNDVLDA